jgi:hypothetical protein
MFSSKKVTFYKRYCLKYAFIPGKLDKLFIMNYLSFCFVSPSISADFTPPRSGSAFRMRIRIQEANRMRIRIRNTGQNYCLSAFYKVKLLVVKKFDELKEQLSCWSRTGTVKVYGIGQSTGTKLPVSVFFKRKNKRKTKNINNPPMCEQCCGSGFGLI